MIENKINYSQKSFLMRLLIDRLSHMTRTNDEYVSFEFGLAFLIQAYFLLR